MSEKLRESLSAAIDDEADEFELRRVLDEMHKDPELRDLWDRYHTAGQILRGEPGSLESSLRNRVWAALDAPEQSNSLGLHALEEPASAGTRGQWMGRITGVAVAAGVAFAIIFGLGAGEEEPASQLTSAVNIEGPTLSQPNMGNQASPSDVQRANAYMMHHVQQQALNQPGVTSFVKLVTFEDP